ncbi:hypothetical protein IQ276_016530 [Desmonostoc muscorum LEGE 12446]|uniref:Uncharacterized protein n=1 Tax=Desmonostoc muscorum LEGE 12446 TaxID=1828758 RepID=A0A8J6ZKH6_DESMC|nr:hypothetical protein [Desmonostoc muscorum]MCF2148000.1 hypothetical protein [Desmonostoc muscorum LEGE 12446]
MMFYTNNLCRILIVTGIAVFTSSIYPCNAQAQSLTEKQNILLAQNLGGIVRKIPLEEVPTPAMSAAKTVTNAEFNQARIEMKSDGSLIYILR